VLLALATALTPMPSRIVEAWYSRGIYPAIQTRVTPLTNAVPVALLDLAALMLLTVCAFGFRGRVRRLGFVRALVGSAFSLLTLAAAGYLAFLFLWGLNYRRVPLDQKVDFERARVNREAVRRLGDHAVRSLNSTHAAAHDSGVQGPTLEAAFASAQRMLGSHRLAVPGLPKRSVLQVYFRVAAIDGLTNPFFHEIIINPDALPFERPFVVAHEWAHLAGYAHEAEANFVAWLTCLQGNSLARYSGWLAIYQHVVGSLPEADGSKLAATLAAGPREDLKLEAARYARSSPVVRNTARDLYDSYLRANRVDEGIASYTAVVRLILGAGIEDGRGPTLR
jgi:hypothetical protein